MPLFDDRTIPDDAVLFRVLHHPGWVTNKGGLRRPSSIAFYEAQGEVSFFVETAEMLPELRRIFPGSEIAKVPAAAVREVGLAIERRPAECPDGFRCDPANHVVVGPPQEMERNVYERRARSLAKKPEVTIVPPEHRD